jgi:hypothetical protein
MNTMPGPASSADLSPEERRQLTELVNRFIQAWQQADVVDLKRFVPAPESPLRSAALIELIKIDLQVHWQRRLSILLEDYLRDFPELQEDQTRLAQLLHEEYRARIKSGDCPPLNLYRARFPDLFAAFEELARTSSSKAARSCT